MLPLCSFHQPPCCVHSGYKYYLPPCSEPPLVYSSLHVQEHVSHLCKATRKIILLCVSYFLVSDGKTKDAKQYGSKRIPKLICSSCLCECNFNSFAITCSDNQLCGAFMFYGLLIFFSGMEAGKKVKVIGDDVAVL